MTARHAASTSKPGFEPSTSPSGMRAGRVAVDDDHVLRGPAARGAPPAGSAAAPARRSRAARPRRRPRRRSARATASGRCENGVAPSVITARSDQVELRPVADHERDGVAAADAEPGETAGERVDAARELRPGERDGVVERAHGDAIGRRRDGARNASLRVAAEVFGAIPVDYSKHRQPARCAMRRVAAGMRKHVGRTGLATSVPLAVIGWRSPVASFATSKG